LSLTLVVDGIERFRAENSLVMLESYPLLLPINGFIFGGSCPLFIRLETGPFCGGGKTA
jgi:hypothetical protein